MANSVHGTTSFPLPNPFVVALPPYAPGSWTQSLPNHEGVAFWHLGRAFTVDVWCDLLWNVKTT